MDQGGPVLVLGPPGIGKTTMVRNVLRDRPHAAGVAVAGLVHRPYVPLMHAVGATLRGDVDAVASTVLVALTGRVLFVDDVHWADRGTIDVLGLLLGRLPIVATARPDVDLPWSAEVHCIELGPLPVDAARRLARRIHAGMTTSERDRLLGLAGGNPLLIEHLAADDVTTPTLRAAMEARLGALPVSVRRAVVELAVHARPLTPDQLSVPVDDVPAGLVEVADGRVALRHPMLADAALEGLDRAQLVALHRDLGARLPADEAAPHLLAAGDVDGAARCARAALVAISDPVVRAELLAITAQSGNDATRVEAAAASITAGNSERALRLLAGVTSADPLVLAAASLQRSRACWFAGDAEEAHAALVTGIAALAESDDPLLARLYVERAHQLVRTLEASASTTAVARDALAVAERLGVDVPRARNVLATALAHDGRDGWEELYREVIPEAAAARDVETECSASYFLASHLGFAGRYVEATDVLEASIARASALGEVTWRDHMTGAALTDRFMAGGEPAEVARDARHFIECRPVFRNRAQIELALALSLGDLGELDEATAGIESALEVLTSGEDRSILLAAATELAWMACDLERAVRLGDLAAEHAPGWFGITAGATAAAALASFELGRPVTQGIDRPKVPIFATFQVEIDALRAHSDGDPAAAIALLDTAAAGWRRCGPRRYAVRAQWTAAVIATRCGDPFARRRLEAAEREARCAGLVPIIRRASAALQAPERPLLLTARERDALALVAEGCTSKQIAERLAIAPSTVETHIASAIRKLGARNRRHAASLIERGEPR